MKDKERVGKKEGLPRKKVVGGGSRSTTPRKKAVQSEGLYVVWEERFRGVGKVEKRRKKKALERREMHREEKRENA